jgi:predicted ester cyclase
MGEARRAVEEGVRRYNSGQVEELISLYAEDAVEIMPTGTFTGRPAVAERLRCHFAAFPDTHMTPRHWVAEGDTVVLEFEWVATHTGPLSLPDGTVLPPTGRQVHVPMVSIQRVLDDKTVEHRLYCDQLTLATQMGLAAPPG